jgi:hypothetical protein
MQNNCAWLGKTPDLPKASGCNGKTSFNQSGISEAWKAHSEEKESLEDPAAREEIYKHLEKSLESGNHTKLRQLALSKTCGLKASSRPKRRRH